MNRALINCGSLPGTMVATLLCLSACSGNSSEISGVADPATGGESDVKLVEIKNYQDVLELFAQLNYTPESWQAGIREVPRVYLSAISDQWSNRTAKEIDVTLKKQLFFRALGPLALRSNELILEDRRRLQKLRGKAAVSDADRDWLLQLARDYRIKDPADMDSATLINALLPRVDIIPTSLTLAQAAEESGWGTSRFAFKGNALFGQWTWSGDGITPEDQRSGKGDYKIASFDSPLESVRAHARNLNSHPAYADFRQQRAKLRAAGERISGEDLAGTLSSYSERGDDYIKTLRSIISYNRLDPADDAYLGNNQPVVLIPPES